jgi:SNF2 family DNA or RNA helicase
MGTGKSLQALTTFVVDVKRGWAQTLLVVCPVSLKGNWQEEIKKFTSIPSTILEGSQSKRTLQIARFVGESGPRILIANYDQIPAEVDILNAVAFDCIIFDEAHSIKGWKNKTTRACHQLYSHRKLLLTGTPMLNGIPELWPLLHYDRSQAYSLTTTSSSTDTVPSVDTRARRSPASRTSPS